MVAILIITKCDTMAAIVYRLRMTAPTWAFQRHAVAGGRPPAQGQNQVRGGGGENFAVALYHPVKRRARARRSSRPHSSRRGATSALVTGQHPLLQIRVRGLRSQPH